MNQENQECVSVNDIPQTTEPATAQQLAAGIIILLEMQRTYFKFRKHTIKIGPTLDQCKEAEAKLKALASTVIDPATINRHTPI